MVLPVGLRSVAPIIAAIVVAVLAWKAVVVLGAYPVFILPAPEVVAERFVRAWADGTIVPHFTTTLTEIGLGFAVGAGTALPVG